jgi:hypothetical protein
VSRPDDADRRLIWPNAWQFTREECVRLIALRGQVQRGQVSEDTAVTKRLRFVRLMWWRGMYGR